MIEVNNLTKFYGDHKAVDNISFSVKDGTVCGFCGPNGAGKSTTMNIMTGCLSATEGTVTIGIIPAAFLIAGIVVVVRRKRR